MGKRIRKITYAFLIVALFTALNTKVSYAERKQLNIEQAVGNPPEITAYVNGEKVSKDAEYTASFKQGSCIFFDQSCCIGLVICGKAILNAGAGSDISIGWQRALFLYS